MRKHGITNGIEGSAGVLSRAFVACRRLLACAFEHILCIRHDGANERSGIFCARGHVRDRDAQERFEHSDAAAQFGLGFLHFVPRFRLAIRHGAGPRWRTQAELQR